ncbi:MAG: hypothetical protein CL927_17010 [Deltaproteobacteria bacterium]|nr:hypothetical protein [Deltaproteobacteria bacterium]HCH62874.1 hypothetical protein [Deltaproteobacteria bacterium]
MDIPSQRAHGDILSGQVVWTCEHASGAVPADWTLPPVDARWFSTHWGYDRGAAELIHALQRRMGGPAVFGAVSRLVVDLNRPPEHPDLCRTKVEGASFRPNRALSGAMRARRLRRFYDPYHQTLDRLLAARRAARVPTLLFSVHTFTALYEGHPRTLDAGVLFDSTDSGAAPMLLDGLRRASSAEVEPNEPWSGMKGLIYSVARHGAVHDLPYLEIEVRDDHLTGPEPADWKQPLPVRTEGVENWARWLSESLRPVVARFARVGQGRKRLEDLD